MPIGAHSADHWHFCPAIAIAAAEFLAGPICLPLANLGALTYARWPPLVGPASTTCGRSEDVTLHDRRRRVLWGVVSRGGHDAFVTVV